jgi:transposase-like protein
MSMPVVHCPSCQGTAIVRHGTSSAGQPRSRCRACRCGRGRTCRRAYASGGPSPEGKQQIVARARHANGMRDTARVVHVSPTPVINA